MELDIEQLKTGGQSYVDSFVDSLREEAWEELRAAKFADNTEEELTIMKNLWSHGFYRGAEASTKITMGVYEKVNQPKE